MKKMLDLLNNQTTSFININYSIGEIVVFANEYLVTVKEIYDNHLLVESSYFPNKKFRINKLYIQKKKNE